MSYHGINRDSAFEISFSFPPSSRYRLNGRLSHDSFIFRCHFLLHLQRTYSQYTLFRSLDQRSWLYQALQVQYPSSSGGEGRAMNVEVSATGCSSTRAERVTNKGERTLATKYRPNPIKPPRCSAVLMASSLSKPPVAINGRDPQILRKKSFDSPGFTSRDWYPFTRGSTIWSHAKSGYTSRTRVANSVKVEIGSPMPIPDHRNHALSVFPL
jgi:hypothetical protein